MWLFSGRSRNRFSLDNLRSISLNALFIHSLLPPITSPTFFFYLITLISFNFLFLLCFWISILIIIMMFVYILIFGISVWIYLQQLDSELFYIQDFSFFGQWKKSRFYYSTTFSASSNDWNEVGLSCVVALTHSLEETNWIRLNQLKQIQHLWMSSELFKSWIIHSRVQKMGKVFSLCSNAIVLVNS